MPVNAKNSSPVGGARVKSGVKVPAEIENWAFGFDSDNENNSHVDYDSDDFESLDDSYVKNLALSDDEEKQKLEERQRDRIRSFLSNLQRRSMTRSKSAKSNEISSPKPNSIDEEILPKRKSKSAKDSSHKLKSAQNGMIRAVPGQSQKNITLERTHLKDMLKLSQQRYFYKLNIDFQRRAFITRQKKKSLYNDGQSSQSSEMPSSSRPTTSNTLLTSSRSPMSASLSRANSYIKYPVKSVSANAKKRSSNLENLPQDDYFEIDAQKSKVTPIAAEKIPQPAATNESKVNVIYENPPAPNMQERSILKRPTSSAVGALRIKSGTSRNLSISSAKTDAALVTNENIPVNPPIYNADFRRKSSLFEQRPVQSAVSNANRYENRMSSANVIEDERYQSLLSSLSNVYLPKAVLHPAAKVTSSPDASAQERYVNPVERVDNIIKANKALQGVERSSGDKETIKKRHDIETNMKLFEKYLSIYT